MAFKKTYKNVKFFVNGQPQSTAVAGPQTLAAATQYNSLAIPIKDAKEVRFILSATNGNAPASWSYQFTQDPLLTGMLLPGSLNKSDLYNATAIAMNAVGGVVSAFCAANANSRIGHSFLMFIITGHATLTITGFQMDVEVWYEADADHVIAYSNAPAAVPN